ncbi:hypothetical protein GGR52DRAFT_71178 [Hypoxylon sp. FL1284]|nr:hypothetical protein GGR52DRAFT_71178 [Hypoxylon sp. FL1284]
MLFDLACLAARSGLASNKYPILHSRIERTKRATDWAAAGLASRQTGQASKAVRTITIYDMYVPGCMYCLPRAVCRQGSARSCCNRLGSAGCWRSSFENGVCWSATLPQRGLARRLTARRACRLLVLLWYMIQAALLAGLLPPSSLIRPTIGTAARFARTSRTGLDVYMDVETNSSSTNVLHCVSSPDSSLGLHISHAHNVFAPGKSTCTLASPLLVICRSRRWEVAFSTVCDGLTFISLPCALLCWPMFTSEGFRSFSDAPVPRPAIALPPRATLPSPPPSPFAGGHG